MPETSFFMCDFNSKGHLIVPFNLKNTICSERGEERMLFVTDNAQIICEQNAEQMRNTETMEGNTMANITFKCPLR